MSDVLNMTEAGRALGLSQPTMRRLVDSGRIPALRLADRVVRISRADLDAYLESCRVRSAVARKAA